MDIASVALRCELGRHSEVLLAIVAGCPGFVRVPSCSRLRACLEGGSLKFHSGSFWVFLLRRGLVCRGT